METEGFQYSKMKTQEEKQICGDFLFLQLPNHLVKEVY